MLTDDMKQLIEHEERYRHEFKKSLEAQSHAISQNLGMVVSEVRSEKEKLGTQIMVF